VCDVSLFYYSGHGVFDDYSTSQGALVGTTGTVTAAQLRAALDQISGIKIVILDNCYSGYFVGDYSALNKSVDADAVETEGSTDTVDASEAVTSTNKAVIKAFSRTASKTVETPEAESVSVNSAKVATKSALNLVGDSFYVITSCNSREVSISFSDADFTTYAGLMTYKLLEGSGWDEFKSSRLSSADADQDGNLEFTFDEIRAYTKSNVATYASQMGYTQSVMYYPSSSSLVLWMRK